MSTPSIDEVDIDYRFDGSVVITWDSPHGEFLWMQPGLKHRDDERVLASMYRSYTKHVKMRG